jgi:hypothetical protein
MTSGRKEWQIEVLSVHREKPKYKWDSGLRVTLRVVRNPESMSIDSTYIVPAGVDEANAVRLVRNYFHRTMKSLAEQTTDWFIPDEEAKGLSQPEPSSQA